MLHNGARPAEPGEFTRRAFFNGRIDLAQAEAVMDVINAKTEAARSAGLRQLGGGLSGRIERYRDTILKWLAHIELSIDYPEHESEAMNMKLIRAECAAQLADMEKLLDTARVGRILTEGVKTAIIGRPNVGKSSLMNAILREDRAIVTEIPGTTRDVLAEPVHVGSVPLLLMDTAGIRETTDIIEKMGVDRSLAQTDNAELLLLTADRSQPPQPEDFLVFERARGKNAIVILNKCDLPPAEGWFSPDGDAHILSGFPQVIHISAKQLTGLDELYRAVESLFLAGIETTDTDILTGERHRYLLEQAILRLHSATDAIDAGMPEDLVSIDLTEAYRALGGILGKEIGEDVADRIFSEFCVGK